MFDTASDKVQTLIIENQPLLLTLLTDIQAQLDGLDGKAVLSESDKLLPLSKHLELLTSFVPFDLNKKALVSKGHCGHREKRGHGLLCADSGNDRGFGGFSVQNSI